MMTLAFIERLISTGNVWILVPLGAFLIPITAMLVDGWRKAGERREIERTRREIAAYVAEGSISPDDAERIMTASPKKSGGGKDC